MTKSQVVILGSDHHFCDFGVLVILMILVFWTVLDSSDPSPTLVYTLVLAHRVVLLGSVHLVYASVPGLRPRIPGSPVLDDFGDIAKVAS